MNKARKLVIAGAGKFAEVAFEYFDSQSEYAVTAFTAESRYLQQDTLFDLPVVPFESVEDLFPPGEHDLYAAIVYTELNRARARLYAAARAKGYTPAGFLSPHAQVSRSALLGQHCFVFESNVIQPFVSIGDNAVLWSGNHIGHHTQLGSNVFVSSHVVIAGNASIGDNCFFGVNCAVADGVTVGPDCWIGPGVVISADVPARSMFGAAKSVPSKVDSHRFFRLRG